MNETEQILQIPHPPEDAKGDDGYPSEEGLQYIRTYPLEACVSNPKTLMDFVRSLWEFGDWGWKENDEKVGDGREVTRYSISTGGWSGNEDLISALRENAPFWGLYWEESRRGGHFKFEIGKSSSTGS